METIKSINYKQEEIIKDILKLHNNGKDIDLDPTYSKGIFYKNKIINEPKFKSDLIPQNKDIKKSSSSKLDFENNSLNSIIFDPPFIIHGKTKASNNINSTKCFRRFGGYTSYDDLKKHYKDSLKEFYRILKNNGIVIMKLQNVVSSGKNRFTHFFVIKTILELGFTPIDEFILLNKSKMTSFGGRWKIQRHAMKHHSYFIVFKKKQNTINYN